jgi:hypothetical protein
MPTIKYHRDIHLPQALEDQALDVLAKANGAYKATEHAIDRAYAKGIILPPRIPLREVQIIEVTTEGGRLLKFLLRFPSRLRKYDVVMSYTVTGICPTVYHNERDDVHHTLDTSQYARAS